ncbi:MAG: hypothetical protein HKP27_16195 [Myxococcales bacterium]|nr:hypothetical protein [Myxococcales bacterium]
MRRATLLMACLASLAFMSACASDGPTKLDKTWGESLRANREAMVENPNAGFQEAHRGLDAKSAEHVIKNYEKGQDAQEHRRPSKGRATVNVIGVGQ